MLAATRVPCRKFSLDRFVQIVLWIVFLSFLIWLATALNPSIRSGPGAPRTQSMNCVKNLVLAIRNYHDENGQLPEVKLHHGWGVSLLPFLDNRTLYDHFDFTKLWNAPANEALSKASMKVFLNPDQIKQTTDAAGYPLNHYAVSSQVFTFGSTTHFDELTDGLGETILGGEISAHFSPWASPGNIRDPSLGLNNGPLSFSHPRAGGGVILMMADGRVVLVSDQIAPTILKALSTPAGGETIPEQSW